MAQKRIAVEDSVAEAWHLIGGGGEPAFQNGWSNSSVGDPPAGFLKDRGEVRLKGSIKGGTNNAGTTILTLPVGYRPTTNKFFIIWCEGSSPASGFVYVDTNGNLKVYTILPATLYVLLDQVRFPLGV